MGQAKARGDYAARKAAAMERPKAITLKSKPAQREPLALYRPVTRKDKNGKIEHVVERHKDGETMVSADGRTRYVMDRRGLRRIA